MLLVGVVATTLSMKEFWTSSRTYSFIMKNITLRGVQFDLPGVFQSLKYGGAMNGSLWSLPVEIRLYIILACCGLLGLFRKGAVFNVWAIGIFATALLEPHWIFFFKTSPANLRVAAFFLLGSLLYINRARVPLHWPFLALFAAVSAMCFGTPAYQWLADLTVAYAVFVIAFAPKIKLPNYIEDFSFGIYLYAWPFQQLIAHAKPEWGPYEMAACALPAAWLAGVLSWYAVEKPALRLRRIKFIALGRSLFVGSSGRVQQKSPS
jgi:peptidoglycan/LPS O-acetylase OafA/YrhL